MAQPAARRASPTMLLLGGTAWLGSLLAASATASGWAVTCLARGLSRGVPPGCTLIRSDRDDPAGLAPVAGTAWDVVVDLTRHPGHARAAATQLQAGHAVFISTCSVYAEPDAAGANEDAAVLPALAADRLVDAQDYGSAKVACELAWVAGFGERHTTVVRPGLIAGPGDATDRTGYWPARFAAPSSPQGTVLVPAGLGQSAQVIDARDLAAWVVRLAAGEVAGTYNAVGNPLPLSEHLQVARGVGGHTGPVVTAADDWLLAQQVVPWAGPRSLPLWLPDPQYRGFAARSNALACDQGLELRELAETLADTLAWHRTRPADHRWAAGLADAEERELIAAWLAGPGRGDQR